MRRLQQNKLQLMQPFQYNVRTKRRSQQNHLASQKRASRVRRPWFTPTPKTNAARLGVHYRRRMPTDKLRLKIERCSVPAMPRPMPPFLFKNRSTKDDKKKQKQKEPKRRPYAVTRASLIHWGKTTRCRPRSPSSILRWPTFTGDHMNEWPRLWFRTAKEVRCFSLLFENLNCSLFLLLVTGLVIQTTVLTFTERCLTE